MEKRREEKRRTSEIDTENEGVWRNERVMVE